MTRSGTRPAALLGLLAVLLAANPAVNVSGELLRARLALCKPLKAIAAPPWVLLTAGG
jgi:hypothetical protein